MPPGTRLTPLLRTLFTHTGVRRRVKAPTASVSLLLDLSAGTLPWTASPLVTSRAFASTSSSSEWTPPPLFAPLTDGLAKGTDSAINIGRRTRRKRRQPSNQPYVFPLTRALEQLRRGQSYHHLTALFEHDADMSASPPLSSHNSPQSSACRPTQTPLTNTLNGTPERIRKPPASLDSTPETAQHCRRDEEQSGAAAFLAYHCHHLYVAAKHRRKEWSRFTPSHSHPEPAPASVRADRLKQVTETILHATVLLHTSALYGLADDRVEALLEICLSSSVFLSQMLNAQRHEAAARVGRRGSAPPAPNDNVLAYPAEANWRCLLRAVFHYAEGVRLWDLGLTDTPLFPSQTDSVLHKLLQAHAGSLLTACTESNTRLESASRQHVAALLAGAKRQATTHAIGNWFGDTPQGRQRRALQLFPLLWLSTAVSALAHKRPSSPLDDSNPWQFSWTTARFSFVHLVRLFDSPGGLAPLEVTGSVLRDVLYMQAKNESLAVVEAVPSREEVLRLLAVLEPAVPTVTWRGTHVPDSFFCRWLRDVGGDGAQQRTCRAALVASPPPPFRSLRQALEVTQWIPFSCVSIAIGLLGEDDRNRRDADELAGPALRCLRAQAVGLCVRWPTLRPRPAFHHCAAASPGGTDEASHENLTRALMALCRTVDSAAAAVAHVVVLVQHVQNCGNVLASAHAAPPRRPGPEVSNATGAPARRACEARIASVHRWLLCVAELLWQTSGHLRDETATLATLLESLGESGDDDERALLVLIWRHAQASLNRMQSLLEPFVKVDWAPLSQEQRLARCAWYHLVLSTPCLPLERHKLLSSLPPSSLLSALPHSLQASFLRRIPFFFSHR